MSFITNHAGEYPNETKERENFQHEEKYPNLAYSEKNNNKKFMSR